MSSGSFNDAISDLVREVFPSEDDYALEVVPEVREAVLVFKSKYVADLTRYLDWYWIARYRNVFMTREDSGDVVLVTLVEV